ncbi:amidohydrolase family protein [Corallococcus sp. c25j21]|nr:amidohydrolase family protein [Corallococcus silvisoli]
MNRYPRRESPGHWPALPRSLVFCAALALLSSCTTKGGVGTPASGTTVFVGKVVTMDDLGTIAEAVSVDSRGHIVKVGTEKEVMKDLGPGVGLVRLAPGQVLMPGFIDPHLHLLPTLAQSLLGSHNLAPCLPPPYKEASAPGCESHADLLSALKSMRIAAETQVNSKEFILGMNLDPSRQQFVAGNCGVSGNVSFMAQPKLYLDNCVSKDRPVLILDQSGHLAYVNQKAFDVVCKGAKNCTTPASVTDNGGRWRSDANGFTGLIEESAGYAPFMAAMEKSLPLGLVQTNPIQLVEAYEKDIQKTVQELRKAGLTTLADGGLSSASQIQAVKFLAERRDFPMRITGLVTYDAATQGVVAAPGVSPVGMPAQGIQPTGPACDPSQDPQCQLPRWLGVGGIKLWVDGSTQGCTAWLESPYQYLSSGHCPDKKEGEADFQSVQAIVDSLSPLWKQGSWRFQLHANGNLANQWAVDAFSKLQLQNVNPHRALLIHNTLGQEQVTQNISDLRKGTYVSGGKKVPALDVRVTHLIGHVAYWGDAFNQMLGKESARNIDPVLFDRRHGVPFSFHSDSMVTPARPLWFVEQAVTRRTWAYPDFKTTTVLGPEHAATVEEALRAITVEPARQHELDAWLGSIEPGKVADFVVLGANPLDYDPAKGGDPTKISQIPVIQTYLNGQPTGNAND